MLKGHVNVEVHKADPRVNAHGVGGDIVTELFERRAQRITRIMTSKTCVRAARATAISKRLVLTKTSTFTAVVPDAHTDRQLPT